MRPFDQIDEYLSREDAHTVVLESLVEDLFSRPRSADSVERITTLKDRLRKIRKREKTEPK